MPYRLLKCDGKLSVGDPGSGNLLVEGDNLRALKALLPYYAGQVKCIYIDPPYNTGNENWIYNDAVNSPEIRAWLGKIVGKEAEDLSRHDKWLCMMYPRLRTARDFLTEDGIIFVSVDDIEYPNLRLLMDEIYGSRNLITSFVWQTEGNFDNQAKIKIAHEYILAYAKNESYFAAPPVIDPTVPMESKLYKKEIQNTIVKNGPKNPVSELILPMGFPASFEKGVITKRDNAWPHYSEDVHVSGFCVQREVRARSGWSSKEICEDFIRSGFEPVTDSKGQETVFVLTSSGAIECIKKRSESQSHVISVLREVGTTQQMSAVLKEMGIDFDYPKPLGLMTYLISMIRGNNFITLDFFAGSGTTGHAVLALNKQDLGHRRFILVDSEKRICEDVTAKRLSYVINGYKPRGSKNKPQVEGLGGGFRYCGLGETLFDENGRICKEVKFNDLARHVFLVETGSPLSPATNGKRSALIGLSNGTAYYLLFNGILGDRTPDGGNVLTSEILAHLPENRGPRVIFGEGCRLGPSRLKREGVTFKQIPYEIKAT